MSGNTKRSKLKKKKDNWYTVKQGNVTNVKKRKIERSIESWNLADDQGCYTKEAWEYINDSENF